MKNFKKFAAFFFLFSLAFQSASLWAASKYDIKKMTPEIEQALGGRQSRYEELRNQKAAGRIGENNRGYAESFDKSATLTGMVHSENEDRRVIYNAIVEQNGLGPNGIAQVEAAFAEVQREKARSGESIQQASGEWRQK